MLSRHIVSSPSRAMAAALRTQRFLVTEPNRKSAHLKDMKVDPTVRYPTVFKGLTYVTDIFGVDWTTKDQCAVQEFIWHRGCFLPSKPAVPLTGTHWAILSDVAGKQAVELADGSAGLLASNNLRSEVQKQIVDKEGEKQLHAAFLKLLQQFQAQPTEEVAQTISNVAFWSQWLIRGVLFEGKMHEQKYTDAIIPAPLSQLAFSANAALGRHQIEFVYDDYTLKAANFPEGARPWDMNHSHPRHFDALDYDSSAAILQYIADIDTPVGFNDVKGGRPEHNFRHNHSLMELQMARAVHGWRKMSDPKADGDALVSGWHDISVAAERAHKVFNTMMTNTPANTYPMIRLPIKGVRGACGTVYPPNGVFYEGCGKDAFLGGAPDEVIGGRMQDDLPGCYVDWDFGQTGANSSMFKWLDIFVGVTKQRQAYNLEGKLREKMLRVVKGEEDPGTMGENPIDSMQRAFDLLTRPALHLDELASVAYQVETGPYHDHQADTRLQHNWELAAYHRFRTAFFVASHRNVHGKYTLKMIYKTQPVGGQSRAEGTGGSTPPFLKIFFDQTFEPAMQLSALLLENGRESVLGKDRIEEIKRLRRQLEEEMQAMARVQQKGLELEREEKKGVFLSGSEATAQRVSGQM